MKITIEQAIERLTQAIGCYGSRCTDDISLHWKNGIDLRQKGIMIAAGTISCAKRIEEIEEERIEKEEELVLDDSGSSYGPQGYPDDFA